MVCSGHVMDHCDNPRNVGKMDDKDGSVGAGMVGAPACGDVMLAWGLLSRRVIE
jgi:nitrogen fixation NifU-like protein